MDGNTLFARQWRVEGVHRQLRDERVPAERDFDSFVVGRTHWEINISSRSIRSLKPLMLFRAFHSYIGLFCMAVIDRAATKLTVDSTLCQKIPIIHVYIVT